MTAEVKRRSELVGLAFVWLEQPEAFAREIERAVDALDEGERAHRVFWIFLNTGLRVSGRFIAVIERRAVWTARACGNVPLIGRLFRQG